MNKDKSYKNWLPLPPADKCVICQKPFGQSGSFRLLSTTVMGFGFDDTLIGKNKTPTSELINFYGDEWFMQAEIYNRADTYCKNGYRPWGCVSCFGFVCKCCGSPLSIPSDAFYIDDKGNLVDAPKIAGRISCSIRLCSEYSNS